MNEFILPEYSLDFTENFKEFKVSEEDRKQENSLHLTCQLLIFPQILGILQATKGIGKGKEVGSLSMKDLSVRCTKRGSSMAKDVMPGIKEVLKVAREANCKIDSDAMRMFLFEKECDLITTKLTSKHVHFYPGKDNHNMILNNHNLLGLSLTACAYMYFIIGICDYQFPSSKLNRNIENVLKHYDFLLHNRLTQLNHYSDMDLGD